MLNQRDCTQLKFKIPYFGARVKKKKKHYPLCKFRSSSDKICIPSLSLANGAVITVVPMAMVSAEEVLHSVCFLAPLRLKNRRCNPRPVLDDAVPQQLHHIDCIEHQLAVPSRQKKMFCVMQKQTKVKASENHIL